MTKPVGFVNKDLAPIYGLSAASYGTDLTMANLDPTQRAGVFTQRRLPGRRIRRTTGRRPILRGAFIEKQVLCRQIGAPPPGARSTPLPPAPRTQHQPRAGRRADVGRAPAPACHARSSTRPASRWRRTTASAPGRRRRRAAARPSTPWRTSPSARQGRARHRPRRPDDADRELAGGRRTATRRGW